jgi:hypothetical protein
VDPHLKIFYLGSHFGFKMAAIANKNGRDMVQHVKMATKYKNPPIWAKFGFQVDYDVAN